MHLKKSSYSVSLELHKYTVHSQLYSCDVSFPPQTIFDQVQRALFYHKLITGDIIWHQFVIYLCNNVSTALKAIGCCLMTV